MKKKILSLILALLMLVPNVTAFAEFDNEKFDKLDMKAMEADENQKVKDLIFQTKGKVKDEDRVKVIVTLKPESFRELGEMVDAKELYSERGIKSQINFGKAALEKALAEIRNSGINIVPKNEFNVLLLGFDTEISFKDAKEIAKFDFVKSVSIQNNINKPISTAEDIFNKKGVSFRSAQSRDIIGNEEVYSKYKGEGTIVAVIDSGFDTEHEAFYLTDLGKEKALYSKEKIEKLKADGVLEHGFYKNEKIPYIYNYYTTSNHDLVKERNENSHGQHVAGTVAGNRVTVDLGESKREIIGVAPEAQLALMRVFSDDNAGTAPAIYLKALEDCAKLNVTAVNMSIGAPAGDSTNIDKEILDAINRLEEAGCVVAIAAGNNTSFGKGLGFSPKAENPDYGILANPAAAEKSFAVASIENGFTFQKYFYNITKNENKTSFFLKWSKDDNNKEPKLEVNKEFEFEFVGLGKEEDYNGKDVNGKVVLIERGDIPFAEKVKIAKEKGAKVVFIYNHKQGGDEFVGMKDTGNQGIPVACLYYSAGMKLKENGGKIVFKEGRKEFINPLKGQISEFSSFGLTSDGIFKPEITAPGGNIFSLGNDNTYNVQSGTSMATPHVAGALALARSMVDERFPELSTKEKWQRIRNLLMSTAEIHYNYDGAATSPRSQGAGVMKLQKALHTKAILIGDNNETKLFKRAATDNETLTFKIQNLSDEELTYNYKTIIVADRVTKDGYLDLKTRSLRTDYNGEVTLGAKETKEISVNIDTRNFSDKLRREMPNGYFIDGFVVFEDQDEPTISIPFITFVGDLDRLAYVEPSIYDLTKENKIPFYWNEEGNTHIANLSKKDEVSNYDFTHLYTNVENRTEILGQVKDYTTKAPKFYDKHVLSPNRDGYADYLYTRYTMLRSGFVDIDIYKLDENGNKSPASIQNFLKKEEVVKNFGSPMMGSSYYIDIPFPSNSAKVEEGNYVVTIKSYRDENKPAKDVDMYFTIDITKPTLENVKFENNVLSFVPKDENEIREVIVKVGDKIVDKTEEGYSIPEGTDLKDVVIEVKDLGYNTLKTTAKMALENKSSGANINVKLNKEDPDFKLNYTIIDENGREFFEDNLAPGKYSLKIENPSEIYKIEKVNDKALNDLKVEKLETEELDDNGKKIVKDIYIYDFEVKSGEKTDINVEINKLDAHYVYFWLYNYTNEFKGVTLENKKTKEKIDLDLVVGKNDGSGVGAKAFSKLIPYGEYIIIVNGDTENYDVKLNRTVVENGKDKKESAGMSLVVDDNSKLNKAGNISFDIDAEKKSTTLNIFGENQDKVKYNLNLEGTDDKASFINLAGAKEVETGAELAAKNYLLLPIPEEGYYAEPALVYLELGKNKITKFPNKTASTFKNGEGANVQVDIKKSEGFGSLEINDNSKALGYTQKYLVRDIRGYKGLNNNVYTDLNKIPEGYYVVTPEFDKNSIYTSQDNLKIVKVNANEKTTLDFAFEDKTASEDGLAFIYSPRKINIKVKNIKTGAELPSLMESEEDNGSISYMFMGNQGVYEIIIEDANGLIYPRYFSMTGNTMLGITEGEPIQTLPVEDNKELENLSKELNEILDKANGLEREKYTEESFKLLDEALTKVNKDSKDAEELKNYISIVKAALDGLKSKSTVKPEPTDPVAPGPKDPVIPDPVDPTEPPVRKENEVTPFVPFFTSPIFETVKKETKPKEKLVKVERATLKIKEKLNENKPSIEFKDMSNSNYKSYVDTAVKRGLLVGVSKDRFAPTTGITRAMVVETLRRLTDDDTNYTSNFKDVKTNLWYYKAVSWAEKIGLVAGYGDNTFKPENNLNIEELAVIIDRFLEKGNLNINSSKDSDRKISTWAESSYKKLIASGILSEEDFGNSREVLTREKLAKVLVKLVEIIEKNN
ncbi:MAG: S8 family serine peptidase [Peptoniphilus duerdenii]|uniref:S8 family serine peptidase n=1 Tax=Peptoniphilus duerdenii TaxID=507750 RepID=UPI00254D6CBD|nr:S8 family serine peptidase [Peptoniphilus duerdenii]MDK8276516.1 S8 family serine peptidase [Peptoniphilus duerdenii]